MPQGGNLPLYINWHIKRSVLYLLRYPWRLQVSNNEFSLLSRPLHWSAPLPYNMGEWSSCCCALRAMAGAASKWMRRSLEENGGKYFLDYEKIDRRRRCSGRARLIRNERTTWAAESERSMLSSVQYECEQYEGNFSHTQNSSSQMHPQSTYMLKRDMVSALCPLL